MEFHKTINLLDNKPSQPTKFKAKDWVDTNYDSRKTCKTNSQIKFKTTMLKSSFRDFSDAYILVKRTITLIEQGVDAVVIIAALNASALSVSNQ